MSDLNNIALQIISNGKGILAADESTATMTKRLENVGIKSTSQNRLLFRETIFKAQKMADCIGGVILYDETILKFPIKSDLDIFEKAYSFYKNQSSKLSSIDLRIQNRLILRNE